MGHARTTAVAAKAHSRTGEHGGAMTVVLLVLAVLGLLTAVGYLAATVNHGRYRFAESNGTLVVERGLLLPLGFEPYRPETEALHTAYAPIQIPPGTTVRAGDVYSERGDLDRALYGVLSGWAKTRINGSDDSSLDLASSYLDRAELLPALSEEQRSELHRLHGEFAYNYALARIASIGSSLQKAREQLQVAVRLGTADAHTVDAWLAELASFEAEYDRMASRIAPRGRATPTTPSHTGDVLQQRNADERKD